MIDITEGGKSMTNTQIVKSLVNLEPDLYIYFTFNLITCKKNKIIVLLKHNRKG